MNKIKRIRRRGGFTLVECVIAIAVFAVLTAMVMLILAQTTQLSKTALDNEDNLADLVQNVVEDKSKAVYGSDSELMELQVLNKSGTAVNDLKITYLAVEGKKYIIECPETTCKYRGSMKEFMRYIEELALLPAHSSTVDLSTNSYTHYFYTEPDFKKLVCPKCNKTFDASDITFMCLGCHATGMIDITADAAMRYNGDNNTITCKACGGTNIIDSTYYNPVTGEADINDTGDTNFMINTFRPNAIRFGTIHQETDYDKVAEMTTVSSDGATPLKDASIRLETETRASKGDTVKYYFELATVGSGGSVIGNKAGSSDKATAEIHLKLPGTYVVNVLPNSNINIDVATDPSKPTVKILRSEDISRADKLNELIITGITDTNYHDVKFNFTLTNFKNANSFEDDYAGEYQKCGGSGEYSKNDFALKRFWFRHAAGNITIPRKLPAKKADGTYDEADTSSDILKTIEPKTDETEESTS